MQLYFFRMFLPFNYSSASMALRRHIGGITDGFALDGHVGDCQSRVVIMIRERTLAFRIGKPVDDVMFLVIGWRGRTR